MGENENLSGADFEVVATMYRCVVECILNPLLVIAVSWHNLKGTP
jgi:hypothetical protein